MSPLRSRALTPPASVIKLAAQVKLVTPQAFFVPDIFLIPSFVVKYKFELASTDFILIPDSISE